MNSMESNKQLCLVGVINNFLNAPAVFGTRYHGTTRKYR